MARERLTSIDILRSLILSFDIDGVVVHTAPRAVRLFNYRFNQHRQLSDLTTFMRMADWIKEVSDGDSIKESMKIWNDADVLGGSPPVPGAIAVLDHLRRRNIQPFFITSRPANTKDVTLRWFRSWLPWVDEGRILMRSGPESGLKFKTRTIKEFGVGIHFEDSLEQATDIAGVTKARVILVNQPWNLDWDLSSQTGNGIIRPTQEDSICNVFCSYLTMLEAIKK
ncbi:HAD family hydrolase [Candidatus Woesebacteria bacterium]|nr:HAD family hydrolase [Candidatus Woesebacteria bacterium]